MSPIGEVHAPLCTVQSKEARFVFYHPKKEPYHAHIHSFNRFFRLRQVLEFVPISKSSWWEGCKTGRFQKPVKLGPRTTAWRVEDIAALVQALGEKQERRP
jgi:predicted DNA-binding transcriptional regulator AlpA